MARVALNGLGRIGRTTLKIVMDTSGLELVAANELAAPEDVVYLLKYDSVYGRYDKSVTADNGVLVVAGRRLALLHEKDPARLPWQSLINRVFSEEEAASERYHGIVGVSEDPLVPSDIIKDSRASVVDPAMTQVVDGDLVEVMSWYDNEWGYSSQLVRGALSISIVSKS